MTAAALAFTGCGTESQRIDPKAGSANSDPSTTDPGKDWLAGVSPNTLATVAAPLRDAAASMDIETHISRSGIDDTESRFNTSIFVPKGNPPEGGFPIVTLAHRTTGTTPNCAPSLSPTLLDLAPTVATLLKAGYVVAVPDFQGLGKPDANSGGKNTYNPYLDSTTAGYNMVDAAQAARTSVSQTSDSWLAIGIGEGGQAAWAANELANNYDYHLNFVGSVSVSPLSDISGLADSAQNGTLNNDQKVAFARLVAALHAEYPDVIDLDDFRRGVAQQQWDNLLGCQPAPTAVQVAAQIPPEDLRPTSAEALDTLRGFLQKVNLPQAPAMKPMLVTYSGTEPVSPAAWTDRALNAACKLGDTITIRKDPQPQLDSATTMTWINDRFTSTPAPSDCEGHIS
ncbi:lipase [Mycolicibacterium boenickei]|nr:lipase family protein [Mycolicibacterium boenickei]UNB99464.1 lipase [Mycolicibacterium boenickei]